MPYHEENENGRIRIGRGVIEGVCARVVDTFEGRILVSDRKGRLKHSGTESAEDEKGFVRARIRDGKLDIKLYLIVQFGASIRGSAEELAIVLRKAFLTETGMEVGLVTMVFVGTLSEKLSRRNIVLAHDGELREITEDE